MGVEKRVVAGVLILGLLIVILSISFVSANWFTDLFNIGDNKDIQGDVGELPASKNADATITLANEPPQILQVNIPVDIVLNERQAGPPVVETTNIQFSFIVYDANGVSTLDDTKARGRFFNPDNTPNHYDCEVVEPRLSITCVKVADYAGNLFGKGASEFVRNYSCTVPMYYYDEPTNSWKIGAHAEDNTGGVADHVTTSFTPQVTEGIELAVGTTTELVWTGVRTSDTNKYSDAPLKIMNTGNKEYDNSAAGKKLRITGGALGNGGGQTILPTKFKVIDVISESYPSIPPVNCPIVSPTPGIILSASAQDMPINLKYGKRTSLGHSEDYWYICLTNMDTGLSGSFSTKTGGAAWKVETA